jgi:hypothetical protein
LSCFRGKKTKENKRVYVPYEHEAETDAHVGVLGPEESAQVSPMSQITGCVRVTLNRRCSDIQKLLGRGLSNMLLMTDRCGNL